VGVEPQVQRIGKYKSFGDSINRTEIAEAQREVISSLLCEASGHWVRNVAASLNKSEEEVLNLWEEEGVKTPADYRDRGFVSGIRYLDQAESRVLELCGENGQESSLFAAAIRSFVSGQWWRGNQSAVGEKPMTAGDADSLDFDLQRDFELQPRRKLFTHAEIPTHSDSTNATAGMTTNAMNGSADGTSAKDTAVPSLAKQSTKLPPSQFRFLAAGMYLRKMRKGSKILSGLVLKEVSRGPRIAVINAVGGISSGPSGNNGVGSDSLVALLQKAERDRSIKGVVLRVDSPGGSALASDVMWRALRRLSREKPVVASMVDVAASGGYYLGMGCDQIVAEELSVTGSIGVVSAKFNVAKLNEKVGYKSETISIGRYAELLSTDRGFTVDEQQQFEQFGQQAYRSFVTKAAASRSMSYDQMHEVAQGRVWTGRQAAERGLVDGLGGLYSALEMVTRLAGPSPSSVNASDIDATMKEVQQLLAKEANYSNFRMLHTASGEVLVQCESPQTMQTLEALRESQDVKELERRRDIRLKFVHALPSVPYLYETLTEPRRLGLTSLLGASSLGLGLTRAEDPAATAQESVLALCEDPTVSQLGLASSESMGLSLGEGELARVLGRLAGGARSGPGEVLGRLLREFLGRL